MTLVLVSPDEQGDLTVVADTLFGEMGKTGSEVGPKIFLVPISISTLDDGVRIPLPHMGFAFAGNVLSGQFTHALASTCLQNLAAPTTDTRPDVEDVAHFYATCAARIYEERRRHRAVDAYGFEGVIFGYAEKHKRCTVFKFAVSVASDGHCVAPVSEVVMESGVPFALGSGAREAQARIEWLRSRQIEINIFSLMYSIINDGNVPTVGGEFQGAIASGSGVELCPVMAFVPLRDGGLDADFSVMGINIHRLGRVGGYVPIGNPLMAQSADDLTFLSEHREAKE